mgnify:CR=1 FL=1
MKRLIIFWMVCCLTLAAMGPGLAETVPLDGEEPNLEAAGEADPSEMEEEDPVPLEDDILAPEELPEEENESSPAEELQDNEEESEEKVGEETGEETDE